VVADEDDPKTQGQWPLFGQEPIKEEGSDNSSDGDNGDSLPCAPGNPGTDELSTNEYLIYPLVEMEPSMALRSTHHQIQISPAYIQKRSINSAARI
jgi:hypothetical protein